LTRGICLLLEKLCGLGSLKIFASRVLQDAYRDVEDRFESVNWSGFLIFDRSSQSIGIATPQGGIGRSE
jgi:hypothetical protein